MEGVTLEKLKVIIEAQTKPFREELAKVKNEMKNATSSIEVDTQKVKNVMGDLKKFIAGLGIGMSFIKIAKDSVTMARQVEASTQQVNRLMGESAQAFMRWGKENAKAFNMSQADFMQYGSIYGNLLSSFISSTSGVASYTTELLKSSSIIASATGRSMSDVMERIRSGLLGNTEAIEDLGINVNVAMLESTDAFKKFAGNKSWNQLDFQTQQAIRMFAILEQTTNKFGTSVLSNTNSRLAQLTANIKDIALNIGNVLLPILNAVLPVLINVTNVIKDATSSFATFISMLFGYDGASSNADNLTKSQNSYNKSLDQTAKSANKAKKALGGLMGIDELTVISSQSNASDDTSSLGKGLDLSGGFGDDLFSKESDTSGVKKTVDKIKSRINNLRQFLKVNQPVISSLFIGMFSGIGVLGVTQLITAMIGPITSLVGWMVNFGLAIKNFGLFKTVLSGLGVVMGGLTWPITALVAGIASVTAAIAYLYQTSEEFRNLVTVAVGNVGHVVNNLWNSILKPLFDFLGEMYNAIIVPIATFVGNTFVGVVDVVASVLLNLWNEVLAPIAQFLITTFGKAFENWSNSASNSVSGVKEVFKGLSTFIQEILNTIKGVLNGIITFISGVFQGNWKKAWQGIKDVFSSIITGFANIFKKPINAIIDGINEFIKGVNKIKIPSWVPVVGGKGFSIPTIPKLAYGGILNGPTLNIAGEAGQEAVIPLERNTGGIQKIAQKLGQFMDYDSNGEVAEMLMVIISILEELDLSTVVQLDSEVIAKIVNKANDRRSRRMGYSY